MLFEVSEVLVVFENLHRERGYKKILSPFFEAMNNSKQLLIKNIVVVFGG